MEFFSLAYKSKIKFQCNKRRSTTILEDRESTLTTASQCESLISLSSFTITDVLVPCHRNSWWHKQSCPRSYRILSFCWYTVRDQLFTPYLILKTKPSPTCHVMATTFNMTTLTVITKLVFGPLIFRCVMMGEEKLGFFLMAVLVWKCDPGHSVFYPARYQLTIVTMQDSARSSDINTR